MKVSFFWATPKPWHSAEMCILGLFTLHDTGTLDIGLSLYFLEFGIHLDWSGREEEAPDIDEETAQIESIESELNSSTKD